MAARNFAVLGSQRLTVCWRKEALLDGGFPNTCCAFIFAQDLMSGFSSHPALILWVVRVPVRLLFDGNPLRWGTQGDGAQR